MNYIRNQDGGVYHLVSNDNGAILLYSRELRQYVSTSQEGLDSRYTEIPAKEITDNELRDILAFFAGKVRGFLGGKIDIGEVEDILNLLEEYGI
jgi:hypothetical protein